MDQTQFWQVIERSKQESDSDPERQVELVQEYLWPLSLEEVEVFERIYLAFYERSYNKWLWKAMNDYIGFVSDDAFDYFRAWLISQGEGIFREVMQHIERVREFVDVQDNWTLERLNYVAHKVYEQRTDRNLWKALKGREHYPLLGYDWLQPVPVNEGFFEGKNS